MSDESVARRYASALLTQAQRMNTLSETRDELKRVAETVAQTPKLSAILNQPFLTDARKKEAMQTVFASSTGKGTLGFLNLLVDKRRIDLLPEVEAEFATMVRALQNVELATATSAVPLTADEVTALERSLESRTGKNIELKTEVDPALIGGILVRIGDTVLDGSVRGNLDRLRDRLLSRH